MFASEDKNFNENAAGGGPENPGLEMPARQFMMNPLDLLETAMDIYLYGLKTSASIPVHRGWTEGESPAALLTAQAPHPQEAILEAPPIIMEGPWAMEEAGAGEPVPPAMPSPEPQEDAATPGGPEAVEGEPPPSPEDAGEETALSGRDEEEMARPSPAVPKEEIDVPEPAAITGPAPEPIPTAAPHGDDAKLPVSPGLFSRIKAEKPSVAEKISASTEEDPMNRALKEFSVARQKAVPPPARAAAVPHPGTLQDVELEYLGSEDGEEELWPEEMNGFQKFKPLVRRRPAHKPHPAPERPEELPVPEIPAPEPPVAPETKQEESHPDPEEFFHPLPPGPFRSFKVIAGPPGSGETGGLVKPEIPPDEPEAARPVEKTREPVMPEASGDEDPQAPAPPHPAAYAKPRISPKELPRGKGIEHLSPLRKRVMKKRSLSQPQEDPVEKALEAGLEEPSKELVPPVMPAGPEDRKQAAEAADPVFAGDLMDEPDEELYAKYAESIITGAHRQKEEDNPPGSDEEQPRALEMPWMPDGEIKEWESDLIVLPPDEQEEGEWFARGEVPEVAVGDGPGASIKPSRDEEDSGGLWMSSLGKAARKGSKPRDPQPVKPEAAPAPAPAPEEEDSLSPEDWIEMMYDGPKEMGTRRGKGAPPTGPSYRRTPQPGPAKPEKTPDASREKPAEKPLQRPAARTPARGEIQLKYKTDYYQRHAIPERQTPRQLKRQEPARDGLKKRQEFTKAKLTLSRKFKKTAKTPGRLCSIHGSKESAGLCVSCGEERATIMTKLCEKCAGNKKTAYACVVCGKPNSRAIARLCHNCSPGYARVCIKCGELLSK